MVLNTIKQRVKNPLGRKVKIDRSKKQEVIFRKLDPILSSEEGKTMISRCENVSLALTASEPVPILNKLIDFTLPLHTFRKTHKPTLKWIEGHIKGFAGEPVDEFIKILKGDYQNIHIYFDTKNFSTVAFEGMKITFKNGAEKETITLGELRKKVVEQSVHHLQLVDDIRGYMLRTFEVLEKMQKKTY